ncbi:uncharacterized protein LOC126743819 [Anthonomus grandis grandis]|uniref:uncharacterized protein LOC126743819 n=1 Tax=Anthonomus grandis grandis TaxID=2921223 RepID=UPI0021660213|nr:uncharacterized protein LOC126743819 [Anthonomus grandis grandis]
MGANNIELPFFPRYETDLYGNGLIRISWFEPKFSQSHYNIHNISNGSNACTLIAVLMASKLKEYNVLIHNPQENLNIRLIHLLAISMLQGNKIHEDLKKKNMLKHINLNIPEAIKYTEKETSNLVEWKSSVYMERLSRTLCENIKSNFKEWVKLSGNEIPDDLYIILVTDSRTVLFLLQAKTNTVTLFDSHQHTTDYGALIAVANIQHLGQLCYWFKDIVRKCYNADPKLYELSFLYFKNNK